MITVRAGERKLRLAGFEWPLVQGYRRCSCIRAGAIVGVKIFFLDRRPQDEQPARDRVRAVRVHRPGDRPPTRRPLPAPGHGSWYYATQVTTVGGRRARYRRGGYATRESAAQARRALLDAPVAQAAAAAWTTARWLRVAEPSLRPSTIHSYCDHVDRYLIPSLGRIALADLTGAKLQACFDLLARRRTSRDPRHHALGAERRRPRGPAGRLPDGLRQGRAPGPAASCRVGR